MADNKEAADALQLLAGLHPCLTIDGPPMEVAQRIFDAVIAEQSHLKAEIANQERNLESFRQFRATGLSELRAEVERHEDLAEKLLQWAKAYPLSVFPEPDMARASELLQAGGMSLDAISASNMRHVIEQVEKMVLAARSGTSAGEGEVEEPSGAHCTVCNSAYGSCGHCG